MGCATTLNPSQRESISARASPPPSRTFVRKNKDPDSKCPENRPEEEWKITRENVTMRRRTKKAWKARRRGHYVNIIISTCGVRRWVVPGLLKNDYPARRCEPATTRPNSDGRTFPVLVRWWRVADEEDALDQTDQERKRKILCTQPHVSIVLRSAVQPSQRCEMWEYA